MNAVLSTLPAFAPQQLPTTRSTMDRLQHDYEVVTYQKGQVLFQEGHTPWGLFYIRKGKIKLYKHGSDGKEQIVRIIGAGEFVGYTALLNELKYHTSASILEEAVLTFIPRQDFLDTFGSDARVAQHFTHLLCRDVVATEQRLVAQSYQPVRGRLANALLSLDSLYETNNSDEESFIRLSRHDLASLLGTAKETVIRLLSEFKSDQLIAIQGQVISVLNPKGLQRICQRYE